MNITDYEPDAWNKYNCSTSLLGRYVTLFMPENGHLILCEVRICGTRQGTINALIHRVTCLFSAVRAHGDGWIARVEMITETSPLH